MKIAYSNKNVEVVYTNDVITSLNSIIYSEKKIVITDEVVYSFYKNIINEISNDLYILKNGEDSKNFDNVIKIIEVMLNKNYNKTDYIICFGGGMVGDIGGFVSSIYKRGIKFINIPTTLISQVDSSIGGKNGINHLGFKNQIGQIFHPDYIIINTNFLKTLPKEEYLSGLGEVIKYAVLFDEEMFNSLYVGNFNLESIIKKCIKYKIDITVQDEFDQHIRNCLNFGHTIGHAIEAKYHIPHGIAVGYGLFYESKNELIKQLLIKYGWDFSKEFEDLKNYILKDKKIRNNKISIIKLIKIGEFVIEEVPVDEYL